MNSQIIKMLSAFVLGIFLVLGFRGQGIAGTTGKISGTIVDEDTGNPLPAVNVLVVGTDLGAATDQDGQYTILRVPPGTYNLRANMVGYAITTVQDVRINIDQTTQINFELEIQAIQGQTIAIEARRPEVQRDVATSVTSVSDDEAKSLPVTTVGGVISLQAGIQNGLEIRGSNERQALFMLDGIALRDPRNNEPISTVPMSAIKEISVQRGGFQAEYGQVQSGIINVVSKEGSKSGYHGNFTIQYAPPHAKYFQIDGIPDVHDPNSYWMRPYLDDAVCWTGTSQGEPYTDSNNNGQWDTGEPFQDLNGDGSRSYWNSYQQKQYMSFQGWNAISEQLMTNNNPNDDLTPLGAQRLFMYETRKRQPNDIPDYDIDVGFGGPIPLVSKNLGNLRFYTAYRGHQETLLWPEASPVYTDYDWTTRITSNLSNTMKLQISGLMGGKSTLADNWNYGVYTRWPYEIAGGTGGNTMFNMFSDWAYSKANISHNSISGKFTHTLSPKSYYEVTAEHFIRNYDTGPIAKRDTTKDTEVLPGYRVDEYPFGYWPQETVGVAVYGGVQASRARDFSTTQSTRLTADYSNQINFNNLLKTGVEVVLNDLNMDYGSIAIQTQGKTYATRVQMRNHPLRVGYYLQDKLETKGFILNAGVRLDYSNSRTNWWDMNKLRYDPQFITAQYNDNLTFAKFSGKPQWQVSPRLGISHPITENSKLYFNYGHFKQIPEYEDMFRIQRGPNGALNTIGNPNMTLAKTVSYEVGYDHSLFNEVLFQVTGYYRDITDQSNTTTYTTKNGDSYTLETANAYRDIRGLEITLRKSTGRWFSGFVNYTYQASSDGHFGYEEQFQNVARQKKYNEDTSNLYQQRPVPTPYARANLNFHSPQNFGPNLFGRHLLGGLMVNLTLNWSAGGWTTYNPKNISGVQNNVQYVDYYGGTLRLSKNFAFQKFQLQFLVDIHNLLNRLQLRDTGNVTYRQSLHLPKSDSYDNIPGNDRFGDYREPGMDWQPMQYREVVAGTNPPQDDVPIYYEGSTGKYWQIIDGEWAPVNQEQIDYINQNKTYIFNPPPSTWAFLNPRSVTFGIRITF